MNKTYKNSPKIHLMDMMAGWYEFVYDLTEEDKIRQNIDIENKIYLLYVESSLLEEDNIESVRNFIIDKVIPLMESDKSEILSE